MRRTPPSKGFSRGMPIQRIEAQTPPAGTHYYHVPVLITRAGWPLEATSFEMSGPEKIDGAKFITTVRQYEADVRRHDSENPPRGTGVTSWWRPERGVANVVALAPVYLGFVPDATEAAPAPEAVEPESTPA